MSNYHFLPEWAPQRGVLVVIPPLESDWDYIYEEVVRFYIELIHLIARYEAVIVSYTDDAVRPELPELDNVTYVQIPTNDTWVRDFGPLSVMHNGRLVWLDFMFNGWGLKFASNHDNAYTKALFATGLLPEYDYQLADMVLEGGSLEYDDNGTLLTTSECLLSPHRNPHISKEVIEEKLKAWFGLKKVLWLDHGYLSGDDTDSHIDTLARTCPENTICYVTCDDPEDEHYEALKAMETQLKSFTNVDGKSYRLVALPMAPAIYDPEDGHRLPSTYANYLVVDGAVIVPTYADEAKDTAAIAAVKACFKDRDVVGIDCRVLIRQHGSLHCSTMQLPR